MKAGPSVLSKGEKYGASTATLLLLGASSSPIRYNAAHARTAKATESMKGGIERPILIDVIECGGSTTPAAIASANHERERRHKPAARIGKCLVNINGVGEPPITRTAALRSQRTRLQRQQSGP